LRSFQTEGKRQEAVHLARQFFKNSRTHPDALTPSTLHTGPTVPITAVRGPRLFGTILTGEMFAPSLSEQISRYNKVRGTKLNVIGVPNTYFGGDVAVAGLLTGQDYLNIKDRIVGDFAVIPKHTIKSDEPILLDGMSFDELKSKFPVPMYDLDLNGLIEFLN